MSNRKWRVLLVDDEPSIQKMIGKRLEVEGFDVLLASDGKEALAIAMREHPDVIILDLLMPSMDGFQVCEELKKSSTSKDIPIVAVFSGKGEADDEQRCRKLGAAAYVPKGQGAAQLLSEIKELLAKLPPGGPQVQ